MANQTIRFVTSKREDVKDLERLLHKTLPQLGLELVIPMCGARTKEGDIDFGIIRYATPEGDVVKYEYTLQNRLYTASLDLSKLPELAYQTLNDLIEESLPRLFKQKVS